MPADSVRDVDEEARRLPLEDAVRLLFALEPPRPAAGEDEAAWQARRAAATRAWAETWRRLDGALAEAVDPDSVPRAGIEPAGTGLPAGVAPHEIDDPALRAGYEAELGANARLAERRRLERLAPQFREGAETYLVAAHRQPPDDRAALSGSLDGLADRDAAERILRAVR